MTLMGQEPQDQRSTIPVFKAHGMAQASISDCVTETFSAIRTVGLQNASPYMF